MPFARNGSPPTHRHAGALAALLSRFGFPGRIVLPLVLGLLLRLWFVHHDPDLTGDPLLYGAIARNLLQHGVYGFAAGAPTLIRLPGYPLFLAACFQIFGVEHYYPVLYLQVAVDLTICWVLSRVAFRLAARAPGLATGKERAAGAALWLAALCPFTAAYTAAPLTETLELASIALSMYGFVRTLPHPGFAEAAVSAREQRTSLHAGWFALAAGAWIAAALLRPDGALLGAVLCPALVWYGWRSGQARQAFRFGCYGALASLLAFVPWAVRNARTFHVFEPLAPRYATDPGEPTNPGFQHWTKTLCADLVCTSEVYWAADDDRIGLAQLPSRAFDSPQELRATADLLADYNRTTTITPALDARFAALAAERTARHPLRTRVALPLLRLADMWFRPRVELFSIDLRWWNYAAEGPDTVLAWSFVLLNGLYLGLAAMGAWRRPPLLGVFVAFTVLRCALLLTIEAPEPRYTLECFPMILVLGGIAVAHGRARGAHSRD
ncbi:hypothetical protein [Acidipila sp. EB88]|uniref:hypothetical protein n=1 Tax=Acidipila sp. EB88 TaxID=2305226 RepID=UPI000F5D70A5|nr:hypothetical protein [Acidipila sp. EB88]